MFSAENDDIQMAIGRFVDKYSLPEGELPVLSKALSAKFGNNTAYGDVITTANYEYTVIYRGIEDFDIIEYHLIEKEVSDEINDKERKGFSGDIDRMSARDEITKRKYPSDNYHIEDGETDGNNARLDSTTSQRESQQTQSDVSSQEYQRRSTRLVKTDADGTNFPRVVEVDDNLAFITPQGEICGFVFPNGDSILTHIDVNNKG